MYAGQPPSQQPFPPGAPPGPPAAANASYVLRVHAASETDHRGMLLVEEFQVMPDGATYVKQHRVPPNAVTPFVQQFAQQHPNVRVQQAGGGSGQQSTPQAPPPPMQGHNVAASSPFSTSSIGGLDGYDKYGSSYGSFAAVQAGRTGAGSSHWRRSGSDTAAARASGGGGGGGAPAGQPGGQPQPYAGC